MIYIVLKYIRVTEQKRGWAMIELKRKERRKWVKRK